MKSEFKLVSSLADAQDFPRLRMWQDMKMEIEGWIEGIRDNLEMIEDEKEFIKLQARAEACRYFLELPEVILEEHKTLIEEKEKRHD